jgi:Asp/Glu/hydantoin racemase
MATILVLNPNSSTSVTASMDKALEPLRQSNGPDIACATLAEGPAGIETQAHVDGVAMPVADYFKSHKADAYVIGCFSDPGLHVAREAVDAPVLGIAESAYLTALGLGYRFGVVAILQASVKRHLRAIRQMGLEGRLAADRPLDLGVADMANADRTISRIIEVGTVLRDQDRADVLILGCAGMGIYRGEIESRLGVPVVDPTQAAVMRAIGFLSLGYRRAA